MDASRVRLGSAFEVIVAAGFLAATFIVGSLIVRELKTDRPPLPIRAEAPAPSALPSGFPRKPSRSRRCYCSTARRFA